ncbi:ASCH domain-containing protein [Nocardia sp. XZ_19_369]|uniref:ASCH domain-containing protein n=1 Tax=Nocardia sp. XZ_19_369 TaxID=2769487 RepID=UPI00188EE8FE|nr:ASCH domain-containing protein [Nocardia sp. XZ_19_369]
MTTGSTSPTDPEALPKAEFSFPGPLRDQLVAAILDGSKTSTTGLLADYEHCGEPLPEVGSLAAVADSTDRRVAVIEVTDVRLSRLADVDLPHAIDEGEGLNALADWRAVHEKYWHSPEMRRSLDDSTFTVSDETTVVLQRFHLITDLR